MMPGDLHYYAVKSRNGSEACCIPHMARQTLTGKTIPID